METVGRLIFDDAGSLLQDLMIHPSLLSWSLLFVILDIMPRPRSADGETAAGVYPACPNESQPVY